jgi:hypothetical protein
VPDALHGVAQFPLQALLDLVHRLLRGRRIAPIRLARLAQLAAKAVPVHCMEETDENPRYSLDNGNGGGTGGGKTPGIY